MFPCGKIRGLSIFLVLPCAMCVCFATVYHNAVSSHESESCVYLTLGPY